MYKIEAKILKKANCLEFVKTSFAICLRQRLQTVALWPRHSSEQQSLTKDNLQKTNTLFQISFSNPSYC